MPEPVRKDGQITLYDWGLAPANIPVQPKHPQGTVGLRVVEVNPLTGNPMRTAAQFNKQVGRYDLISVKPGDGLEVEIRDIKPDGSLTENRAYTVIRSLSQDLAIVTWTDGQESLLKLMEETIREMPHRVGALDTLRRQYILISNEIRRMTAIQTEITTQIDEIKVQSAGFVTELTGIVGGAGGGAPDGISPHMADPGDIQAPDTSNIQAYVAEEEATEAEARDNPVTLDRLAETGGVTSKSEDTGPPWLFDGIGDEPVTPAQKTAILRYLEDTRNP